MAWQQTANIKGPAGAQGPQGIQGVAGPVGPAGLTFQGDWAVGIAYAQHDSVARNGATWFAPAAIAAGNDPNPSGDGHTAANGWALLAAEGAQGPQGVQGIQGIQGVQGLQGPQGLDGAAGARGSRWFTGHGAPGVIAGAQVNDMYLDVDTGDTYQLA